MPAFEELKRHRAMSQKSKLSATSPDAEVMRRLGLGGLNRGVFCGEWFGSGKILSSVSPNDGRLLAEVRTAASDEYERAVKRAHAAFQQWQVLPAPKRGEVIRQ